MSLVETLTGTSPRPVKTADELTAIVLERTRHLYGADLPGEWTPTFQRLSDEAANWDVESGPSPLPFGDALLVAVDEIQQIYDLEPLTA